MKSSNLIRDKSFIFAILVVKCTSNLMKEKHEYVLSKQLLRSGTSIGANIYEAEHAQSKLDFIHKMSIALKEANESNYWIDLLIATDYLDVDISKKLKSQIIELVSILASIVKTSKQNYNFSKSLKN